VLMVHAMDRHPAHRRALPAARAQEAQRMLQPARTGEAAMREQAMIADIDSERPEEVEPAERPGHPRPAEQPGHAGEQGKHGEEEDAGEDVQVEALGSGPVENLQSPEPPVKPTGTPEHTPPLLPAMETSADATSRTRSTGEARFWTAFARDAERSLHAAVLPP